MTLRRRFPNFRNSGLELAGPLAGPALDDNLLVCVEVDRVVGLAVEDAHEAVFPATEGEVGHRRGDTDVDADVAGGDFVAEATGGFAVVGEDRGGVAEGAVGDDLNRVVEVGGVD